MYKSLKTRLPNFFRYVNKVYRFSETIKSIRDKRGRTEISGQTIFMSVFLCMALRFSSFRQLAFEVNNGRLRKFLPGVDNQVGKETFCANTLANGMANIDTGILERELTVVPKKLRRNKAYGTAEHPGSIGGLRIVAVDGTEHFRSDSIHCEECMECHIKTKDGIRIDYVHRIVIYNADSGLFAFISSPEHTGSRTNTAKGRRRRRRIGRPCGRRSSSKTLDTQDDRLLWQPILQCDNHSSSV